MKPRKISDVLWLAANEHLAASNKETNDWQLDKCQYSCDAISAAVGTYYFGTDAWQQADRMRVRTLRFLRSLGLQDIDSTQMFVEFERRKPSHYWGSDYVATRKSQGARYLWLMFAYEVAMEEGK
jgi:hypothetical protein